MQLQCFIFKYSTSPHVVTTLKTKNGPHVLSQPEVQDSANESSREINVYHRLLYCILRADP
jgi:hypothetical protein